MSMQHYILCQIVDAFSGCIRENFVQGIVVCERIGLFCIYMAAADPVSLR
jgi:hypothetical protein